MGKVAGKGWQEVAVIACGPSLTQKQVEACKGITTLCVNNAYQLAPWADALYACDAEWWEHYRPDFKGEKFSAYDVEGVTKVEGHYSDGLSEDRNHIHYGYNSGFQAVNLAVNFGAKRIYLLGFDFCMGAQRHFHADHPGMMNKAGEYELWAEFFNAAKPDFDAIGVEIINCTPGSAITAFKKGTICGRLCTSVTHRTNEKPHV